MNPFPSPAGRRALLAALPLCVALAAGAGAEERRLLGATALLSNDDVPFAGEVRDRWRTGAGAAWLAYGTGWPAVGEARFGEVLVFHLRGEVFAPESFDDPAPGDRPYATGLTFGIHSHARRAGAEYRLGAEVVVTGPQNGLSDLHEWLHELQVLPEPEDASENQIGDAAYLAVSGEAARPWALGEAAKLRPFASARIGDETFARIGADLVGGSLASGGLLVRDEGTGHLVEGTRGQGGGFGWSLGADLAYVGASAYLPGDGDRPGPEALRGRARAGAMWAGERWSAFAGAAWLTPEFDGQDEGQALGVFALTWGF